MITFEYGDLTFEIHEDDEFTDACAELNSDFIDEISGIPEVQKAFEEWVKKKGIGK